MADDFNNAQDPNGLDSNGQPLTAPLAGSAANAAATQVPDGNHHANNFAVATGNGPSPMTPEEECDNYINENAAEIEKLDAEIEALIEANKEAIQKGIEKEKLRKALENIANSMELAMGTEHLAKGLEAGQKVVSSVVGLIFPGSGGKALSNLLNGTLSVFKGSLELTSLLLQKRVHNAIEKSDLLPEAKKEVSGNFQDTMTAIGKLNKGGSKSSGVSSSQGRTPSATDGDYANPDDEYADIARQEGDDGNDEVGYIR
jgi:hypothetical protein